MCLLGTCSGWWDVKDKHTLLESLSKSANPAFKSPAWFCPYCSMLFCDTQKYTIGDDVTTVVVVFCRKSHQGCTDMSLQQNRDKNA